MVFRMRAPGDGAGKRGVRSNPPRAPRPRGAIHTFCLSLQAPPRGSRLRLAAAWMSRVLFMFFNCVDMLLPAFGVGLLPSQRSRCASVRSQTIGTGGFPPGLHGLTGRYSWRLSFEAALTCHPSRQRRDPFRGLCLFNEANCLCQASSRSRKRMRRSMADCLTFTRVLGVAGTAAAQHVALTWPVAPPVHQHSSDLLRQLPGHRHDGLARALLPRIAPPWYRS